jgi:hypothetical protein
MEGVYANCKHGSSITVLSIGIYIELHDMLNYHAFLMACQWIALNGAKRSGLVYLLLVTDKWRNKMDCYLGWK